MIVHLFGGSSGPHLAHFHARREPGRVLLEWELRNAPAMRWRVLCSAHEFAETAEALPGSGQTVVMEGTDTHVTDEMEGSQPYFYSVLAQDDEGWHLQVKAKLKQHGHHLEWHHGEPGVEQAPDPADSRVALFLVAPFPAPPRR